MRIAKYIANAGVCSRRDAEKLILDGKVYINNIKCEKPNINVDRNDKIIVGKKIIKLKEEILLWKFYKPPRIICTNKDPQNRKTLFDILPKNIPRVITVGRLDFMSEGLILLTNNGDIARKLELPTSNIERVYKLFIKNKIKIELIKKINKGLIIEGIKYNKVQVQVQKNDSKISCLLFKLTEGKNREIRNICKYFNWKIIKLIRIQYGSIKLNNQKPGEIVKINLKKIKI